jgi:hypothetical protein
MTEVVEHPSNKHKALSSNPSTILPTHQKIKKKKQIFYAVVKKKKFMLILLSHLN